MGIKVTVVRRPKVNQNRYAEFKDQKEVIFITGSPAKKEPIAKRAEMKKPLPKNEDEIYKIAPALTNEGKVIKSKVFRYRVVKIETS